MFRDLEERVCYLSGYINGIQEIDGQIRQCFSDAILIDVNFDDPIKDIKKLYGRDIGMVFEEVVHIKNWEEVLENDIGELLISDPLALSDVNEAIILDRKKYLSFRIMDQLHNAFDQGFEVKGFFKVNSCIRNQEFNTAIVFFVFYLNKTSKALLIRFFKELI